MSGKVETGCWGWIISTDDTEPTSLERIRAFLAGSGEARFAGQRRKEFMWMKRTAVRRNYLLMTQTAFDRFALCMGRS